MKKILSVDNNPIMLKYMSNLMIKKGHDVTTAEERVNLEEIGATLSISKGPFNLMEPHILSALELEAHGTYQDPNKKPMGTRFLDLFDPKDRQQIQRQQQKKDDAPPTDERIGPYILNGRLITLVFLPITGEQSTQLIILTDVTDRLEAERALQQERDRLQQALNEVKTLNGLLPICANCKKIRDDKGYWNEIESYIRDRSEVDFSHGICPDCARALYPDYFKGKDK